MSEHDETASRPKLPYVNLKTTRLREMIGWYGRVVGAKVTFRFPSGAWISNEEPNHRIALLSSDALGDDPDKLYHCGMHQMAFEFDSMAGSPGVFPGSGR